MESGPCFTARVRRHRNHRSRRQGMVPRHMELLEGQLVTASLPHVPAISPMVRGRGYLPDCDVDRDTASSSLLATEPRHDSARCEMRTLCLLGTLAATSSPPRAASWLNRLEPSRSLRRVAHASRATMVLGVWSRRSESEGYSG